MTDSTPEPSVTELIADLRAGIEEVLAENQRLRDENARLHNAGTALFNLQTAYTNLRIERARLQHALNEQDLAAMQEILSQDHP